MANRSVTLDDVARLAGVSKSTASRIVSAREGQKVPFAQTTQRRVREAAEKLYYSPSRLARGLKGSRTGIVGFIVPSVDDSFFPSVTSVIETRLSGHDISIILANTGGSQAVERKRIEELLDWHVDGLIVAPAQQTSDPSPFWELWRAEVPFVLIDRTFPDTPFPSVTTDDFTGARLVVEHLIATGRRRIARAGGSRTIHTNLLRDQGVTAALAEHGLSLDPSLSIEAPSSVGGGRIAMQRLLELDSAPDALFCFSDLGAIGAMEECLNRGVSIPQDLALVGYADIDHAHLLRVPLTTVRQPREALGKAAAEMLLSLMEKQMPAPPRRVLPVELVVRESA
jgi:LacI family transcriptional regulator